MTLKNDLAGPTAEGNESNRCDSMRNKCYCKETSPIVSVCKTRSHESDSLALMGLG